MIVAALVFAPLTGLAENLSEKELFKRVMDRVKENDELIRDYGYYYEGLFKDLDGSGNVQEEERRLYRTIWLEGKHYFELLKIDGRALNASQKSEELKRRNKFIKVVRENKTPEFKLDWDETFVKYDYTLHSPVGGAAYVIGFQPRKEKQKERTRMEKVFNHIAGKVWVDSEFNITKAHVWLAEDVRFGLGILGNLDELEVRYSQQEHGESFWFPEALSVRYSLRVLIKSRHRQIESKFYDIFPLPAPGQDSTQN